MPSVTEEAAFIGVFRAQDSHGGEYRDHKNKRMLAYNHRLFSKRLRIFLDPGHGYPLGGNEGPSGTSQTYPWPGIPDAVEKHATLQIADGYYLPDSAGLSLNGFLQGPAGWPHLSTGRHDKKSAAWGYEVMWTRTGPDEPSLADRRDLVNEEHKQEHVHLFLSFHCDGVPGGARGSHAIWATEDKDHLPATMIMNSYWGWTKTDYKALLGWLGNISAWANYQRPGHPEDVGTQNKGTDHRTDLFLSDIKPAATILEMVMLTNPVEEYLMLNPGDLEHFRATVAYSIHQGIDDYVYEKYVRPSIP